MPSVDGVARLEQAKEELDAGRPAKGLILLLRGVPSAFAAERDFLTAECLRSQGYFDRAARLYEKCLRRPARHEPDIWIETCLSLASVRRSLGQVPAARALLLNGIAAMRTHRRPEFEERFALEEALVDRAEGRYSRSLAKLARFLKLFHRRRDWGAAAFILWATGGARRFSGDLRGAERDFLHSLTFARRARDVSGEAYALFGLGGVTRIQGQLKRSRGYYLSAARKLRGTQDMFGQAYAHCGLANALRQLGERDLARRHYEFSHKLYSSLGDRVDLAYVDWGLGKLAFQDGKFPLAENSLKRALKGFLDGGEARGAALSEEALAQLLHARGNAPAAERLFARAYSRAKAAGLHTHLEVFT
jgi:tetratricopeptide (TPR) repeat protein